MIEWTEQATRQLDQAHDSIALSNSKAIAARVTMQIVTAVQQPEAFPISGRTGRVPGSRELVIANTPFHRRLHHSKSQRADPCPLSRRATVATRLLILGSRPASVFFDRLDRVDTVTLIVVHPRQW